MDPIVLILVISIYIGSVAAPLSLFILARRTGHGPGWQGFIALCTALIWVALILGMVQEFMNIPIGRAILEPAGVLAVLSFASLAVVSLIIVVKTWPVKVEDTDRETTTSAPRIGPLAADIE